MSEALRRRQVPCLLLLSVLAGCGASSGVQSSGVQVVLGVDANLRKDADWRQASEQLFQDAAHPLESRFGWRTGLAETLEWEAVEGQGALELRKGLRGGAGGAPITLVLTAAETPQSRLYPWDDQAIIAINPRGNTAENIKAVQQALGRLHGAELGSANEEQFLRAMGGFPFGGGLRAWTGEKAARVEQAWRLAGRDEAALAPILAQVMAARGVTDWAVKYRQAAVETTGDGGARLALAADLYRDQRLDEAVETLKKLLAAQPGFAGAQRELGIYQALSGRKVEAEAAFAQALRDDATDDTAELNLGALVAEQLGRRAEAVAHFEAILRRHPGHDGAKKNLELARAAERQFALRAQVLERELQQRPGAEAYRELGVTYARMGDLQRAFTALDEAVALNPRLVSARQNLATVAFLRHDRRRVETEIEALNRLGAPPDAAFLNAVRSVR